MAFIFHPVAMAEDVAVVRSEGVVSGAEAEAGRDVREMALQSAIRNAVGSALDTIMKRESVDLDPSLTRGVHDNPMDYVLNYRVVSEGWVPLPDAATADGQAPRMEKDQPSPQAPKPLNGRDAGVGQPAQKDQPAGPAMDAPAVSTGEYRVEAEVSVDPVRLRALVAAALSGGSTADLAVKIVDVTDYGSYRFILASLGRIALIKDISYGSFSRGRITLSVRTAASSGTLLERIAKEVGEGYSVEAGGMRAIIIRPLRAVPGKTGKLI